MDPAIRLLPSPARSLVFLILAGVGGLGCSTVARVSTSPPAAMPKVDAQKSEVRTEHDSLLLTSDLRPPISEDAASLPSPQVVPPVVSHPLQMLALSGGVQGAPFTAGVLMGWSQTGTRPMFDQVTGISSGSLIGTYAFLGPKYDARMRQLILSMTTADLIRFRPLRCMLCDGSFGSAEPAERLVRRAYDDHLIDDIRCAHAEGRRLYVGTMNLETKRLVIWDIGAIASSGRPDAYDLVRKVLLAAFSWPGAVPPVSFDIEINGHCHREEHVDAGSVAMAFPPMGPLPGCPAGSSLYVLTSRKLYSDPEPVPKRACCRLKPSITSIFEALTRADICHLYSVCLFSGIRFHLMALPQGYHGGAPSITNIYPKEAPELFEMGYQTGISGPCWRLTPPGAEEGEVPIPRDARFIRSSCR